MHIAIVTAVVLLVIAALSLAVIVTLGYLDMAKDGRQSNGGYVIEER